MSTETMWGVSAEKRDVIYGRSISPWLQKGCILVVCTIQPSPPLPLLNTVIFMYLATLTPLPKSNLRWPSLERPDTLPSREGSWQWYTAHSDELGLAQIGNLVMSNWIA